MPTTRATTVEGYLKGLPRDKRDVLEAARALVRAHLPEGYREAANWGMITYEIPLERYPDTYNGQPLGYAALAAQKNYYALYLLGAYADPAVRRDLEIAFRKAGKTMDMGKSCLRFRSLEDLPLDAVARAIASTPPEVFIARYEAARPPRKRPVSRPARPASTRTRRPRLRRGR